MTPAAAHRSGFVSILGRPNAGKSTLLNALLGRKLAIVADKPQTTRTLVQGVLTTPGTQIVFLDTPGIHKPDSLLNRRMMEHVREALDQRDLLLYLADATRRPGELDRRALDMVSRAETPVILVLTKTDLVRDKRRVLPLIEEYKKLHEFVDYVPLSALKSDGIDILVRAVVERLPEGPEYFPPDHVTDQPERFLAAELIREKAVRETHEEVPHSVLVTVDAWEEEGRLTRIYATVRVERDGQKGILIGARGAMLKKIGTLAREEMEALFGRRIYLDLHVRVQPGWREKSAFLDALDWRRMAEKQ
jgi:GTP-binding protein Era